jgi:hypothetical protein
MSISEHFHLTRDAFYIDPWRDAAEYFGSRKPHTQILERIETDFVSARGVPKFIVVGRYGGGKTHTLAHIKHELEKGGLSAEYPAECVYLELAPIAVKERWITFHKRILDAIGLTRLRTAVRNLMAAAQPGEDPLVVLENANVVRFGEEGLKSSQQHVLRNLLYGGRLEQLAWDWLRGDAVSPSDLELLQAEMSLREPGDYVNALLNLASLLHAGLGKKPVLLMDEGEALGNLTNADSVDEITTMIRRLLENVNNVLGIVICVESDGGMGGAPRVLTDEAIQSRLEYEQGYIDLADLVQEEDEAKRFIADVLRLLVDETGAREEIERSSLDMEAEFYPFGENMVDTIAQWSTESPDRSSPRQIMAVLAKAVATAWARRDQDGEGPFVSEDALRDVLYPEEMIPEEE